MRITKLLRISIGLVLCGTFIQISPAYSENDKREKLKMMIEASCRSRRPSESMRIKWKRFSPHWGSAIIGKCKQGKKESSKSLLSETEVDHYSATLSGRSSRIDIVRNVYKTGDVNKPPDAVKYENYVFDGFCTRSFNQVKGSKVKQGVIVSANVNDSILRSSLWEMGFNLCAPGLADDLNVTLKETQDPNIYIVDYFSPKTRWIDRMTIDTGKQCQVIKFENIKRDGSYDYVIDYTYKKHPNGTWFLDSWEKRRYSIRDKNGNPGVEAAAKVEDVEFDIQVPEETLKLKYPKGTRISDSQTDQTYIVE